MTRLRRLTSIQRVAVPEKRAQFRLSDELTVWFARDEKPTLGSLIDVFGNRAFAIVFVMLLGVPALPLPTGGATHLFEIVAVVLALELVFGREDIWLPRRWRSIAIATDGRVAKGLMKVIRRLERVSRPRAAFVFGRPVSNVVFGILVGAGSTVAFLAPPFTGLDTLPALGVVLLSLGVLLADVLVVAVGVAVEAVGALLVIVAGAAAIRGLDSLV